MIKIADPTRALPYCFTLLILASIGCGDESPRLPTTEPPDTLTFDPPPSAPGLPETAPVAFTGVDVVSMGPGGLRMDQTVLVRDAVIQAVGPVGTVQLPDSTVVIDGNGKYLMPGLADMHTHVSVITSFTQVPDALSAEEQGILLIANGVTTILNMGDYERHDLIELRNRWRTGEGVGPNMLVGKFIRGPDDSGTVNEIAASSDQARRLVRRAWSRDYDFIKVYSRLSSGAHQAALSEAEALGLPVFGHLPLTRSLSQALGAGQAMVAHIAQYFSTHYGGQTDPSFTPSAISATTQADAWVVSTLTASESFRAAWGNNRPRYNDLLDRPGVEFTHPEIIERWEWWLGQGGTPNQLDFQMPFLMDMTRDFREGGVRVLLGTDAPELPGLPSGYAVHTELDLLVQSGYSDEEALVAATSLPGEFVASLFPDQVPFGRVQEGFIGDLVLLSQNPLNDVAAASDPLGVMSAGVWYPAEDLAARLEVLRIRYGN